MSNDPAANMARLLALCDDLCETESATVDRRQLCEWLSAMQAQAHDIERLTRERDDALGWETVAKCNQATAQSWIARVSAAEADAAAARRSLRAALVERDQMFKVMQDRADAMEAERDALQSAINCRWTDRADHLSAEIDRTHPFKVKDFERWNRAQVLVSNRHSKGSLIALVAHLLHEVAERDALREAQSTALSLLGEIIRDCNNTGLPNDIVADRVIERVEGWAMEARAALGGQP